MSLERIADSKV